MSPQKRGKIALISVHGDRAIAIGKEEAGGQNVYVKQIGEALSRLGWQVDMFTRKTASNQAKFVEHNANCRTIRLVAGSESFIERDQLFEYLPEFVEAFRNFQQETETIYPIIHTNYWLSGWVGLELKKHQLCKLNHTYHSLGAVKYGSVKTIPLIATTRLQVEKNCLEMADRVVATSPQEEKDMRSLVSAKGKITVIPCGTDIENFGSKQQDQARQTLAIESAAKVILYVGRFDRRKGIETLVRAVGEAQLRRHDNLRLMIAGGSRPGQKDGRERDRIESIVKELGLAKITFFPGCLDREQLSYYYAAADVCVVPSHYEPFGLVAIEAMACGTPVVASDVGGLQYTVVPEVTGLLAPPKNKTAFAQAIDRIISNWEERERLGAAARRRVETHFSWNGVAAQLDKLYRSELSNLYRAYFPPTSA